MATRPIPASKVGTFLSAADFWSVGTDPTDGCYCIAGISARAVFKRRAFVASAASIYTRTGSS